MSNVTTHELSMRQTEGLRLADSIWLAIKFAPERFTDLIILEGSPVYLKSVHGTLELSSLIKPAPKFLVTKSDIQTFFAYHVSGLSTREDAVLHWDKEIAPTLSMHASLSRSVQSPDEEFIRFSLYKVGGGKLGMTIRVTPPPRPIDRSGLPNDLLAKITSGERGLLVLTGPTASGKTATALSLLEYLNQTVCAHAVTIEDPVEYQIKPVKSVFSQREVGIDVGSFAQGLREALRMSPDVLLVGEVRDAETAETAILAGESGALVVITTHGQSASGSLSKLLSLVGDAKAKAMRSVLGGSLLGVVRQELVPTQDGSGYALVNDYLKSTANTRGMIERGEWDELKKLMCALRSEDHANMNAQLRDLVVRKVITAEEALRHSSNKAGLVSILP